MQPEGTRQSGFSFPEACQNKRLCFFQCRNGDFPAHAWILFEEFIERLSAFQVIEERLERDARASEHRFSAVDIWILNNDAFRAIRHRDPPTETRLSHPCARTAPKSPPAVGPNSNLPQLFPYKYGSTIGTPSDQAHHVEDGAALCLQRGSP